MPRPRPIPPELVIPHKPATQLRVCNVISGLGAAGAEIMLYKLVQATEGAVSNSVVSLTGSGPIGDRLLAAGVPVTTLAGRRGVPDPRLVIKLGRLLRAERPSLVHAWMYHANMVGGVAARTAGIRPVLWNIRASNLDAAGEKRATIALAKLGGRAARFLCSRIVVNSRQGRDVHERLGYPSAMLEHIPNGFDLNELRRDPTARATIGRQHGIPADAQVIGIVGRYHEAKGLATFFAAAERVAAVRPQVHFILVGRDVDAANAQLVNSIPGSLAGRVHLLGERDDLVTVYSSFDLLVLASMYEGFPNVVAEAMACEVPCVSTDVGDASEIIGDTGAVVPRMDPAALARQCLAMLALPAPDLRALGARARQRIGERYSLDAVARRYLSVYQRIVQ